MSGYIETKQWLHNKNQLPDFYTRQALIESNFRTISNFRTTLSSLFMYLCCADLVSKALAERSLQYFSEVTMVTNCNNDIISTFNLVKIGISLWCCRPSFRTIILALRKKCHFPAFELNTEIYFVFSPNDGNKNQNNSEYGHFLHNVAEKDL